MSTFLELLNTGEATAIPKTSGTFMELLNEESPVITKKSSAEFYAPKPIQPTAKITPAKIKPLIGLKPMGGNIPEIDYGKEDVTPATELAHGAVHAILPYLNEKELALAFPTNKSAWDFAGEFAGSVIPFSALGKITGGIKILQAIKGAPLATNVAKSALRGAGEMAAYQAVGEIPQKKSLAEKAKDVGISAAIGGILGGATGTLNELLAKIPSQKKPILPGAELEQARAKTIEMKLSDKINSITIKEAGQRIVAGDKTVIPHIKEGVQKLGAATIQDQVINKGIEPALAKKAGAVGYQEAEKGIQSIRPELNKALESTSVIEGIKGWVKDYRIARSFGNVKLAKQLKRNIDNEIIKKGLNKEIIYGPDYDNAKKYFSPSLIDKFAKHGEPITQNEIEFAFQVAKGEVARSAILPTEKPKILSLVNDLLKGKEYLSDRIVSPIVNRGMTSVSGIVAGFEPEIDEKGKPTGNMKFNPVKAAIGVGAMGLMGGIKPTGKPSEIKSEIMPDTAVNKVIQALKEAKPIRGKQEAVYAVERAKQTARIVAMGAKVPGQAGYYAQLGQLKGSMPKVQFESIKNKISQTDVDALFQEVENHAILTPFEKITAKSGLEKLVGARGGAVPTKGEISLLSEVFPPEFIVATLEKRPLMEKLWHGAGEILNLPRAMMATADLSAPLRQGIFLIGRPKQWGSAFRDMFKYAASEKAYQGLTKDIQARPTYKLMRESKLALTDLGENMAKREESFMSNLSEKIPGFGHLARGSNRAYSGFLNKLRADTFDSIVKTAKETGVLDARPEVIHDIAKFVNSATGRGELGGLDRAAVALNGAFFSPRLMASRMNLLNPVYYIKLDPMVRKEALKALFSFSGTVATILGLAKLGGANVGIDPRSADFAKIKVGNTRFDILGGFQQYMVLAARLATGQMVSSTTGKQFNLGEGYKPTTRADIIQRFFESKTSPVGSFVLGLTKGKTSGGDNFDLPVEITNRFIPMVTQDMYDLYHARGLPGIAMGIPGVFGVGSQTYSDQIPLESRTKLGRPTIKWAQTPGLAEIIVNKARGVKVEPVAVKATYDQAQAFIKEGKEQEAQKLVDALSKNDYKLYEKFKQRDNRIKVDEVKVKIEPIYNKVKQLKEQGNLVEAKKIVESLTDDEYKAYDWFRQTDYKLIQ